LHHQASVREDGKGGEKLLRIGATVGQHLAQSRPRHVPTMDGLS
jgi:hypothetical protein